VSNSRRESVVSKYYNPIIYFIIPSLPSPLAGPYQVASEGDQSEADGE